MVDIEWNQPFSEARLRELIRKFEKHVNWDFVSEYQVLSETFIRDFADHVEWSNISWNQDLSERFIREFAHKIDWWYLSYNRTFSEQFMRDFADHINWDGILYDKMSEAFMYEFSSRINWYNIYQGNKPYYNYVGLKKRRERIAEEIAMKMYHPSRIQAWIENGGKLEDLP